MKYCSQCGQPVVIQVPRGDSLPRHVCGSCQTIHYQNPKIVVGCLPWWEDQVLLCKRAIDPRHGFWTLPAGFLENGETTQEGAVRETLEEANARVLINGFYTLVSLPHISQVYMFFRAQLTDLDFSPGDESLETQLFKENEIPWNDLAFPTVSFTLRSYFEDRKSGEFRTHVKDIVFQKNPVKAPE